jgi:peptidoglycan/LPS O-acetylase OafA/YrhL
MRNDLRGIAASDHLNLVRGAAALCVLVYHVRYRFFLDYGDLPSPSFFDKAFYGSTAFGHDAVMVFFVLSGYFIAGSIIRDWRNRRWSPTHYVISRLSRLYVVVLPALILTLAWDTAGLACFGHSAVYSGASQPWAHDFFPVASRLTFQSLIGNALFLQTIEVPPYGSNDPLWSLAFEFWYYLLFPLLFIALFGGKSFALRLGSLALAAVLVYWLGRGIAIYSPIWLLGALVSVLPQTTYLTAKRARWAAIIGFVVFMAVVCAAHTGAVRETFGLTVVRADYLTAVIFALLLYVVLHDSTPNRTGYYPSLARSTADFSFTLYVVHMPLLVFVRAWLIDGRPWQPTALTLTASGLITIVVIGYAYVISRLTEVHTDRIRRAVMSRMPTRARQAAVA